MKRLILLLSAVFMSRETLLAQHCPFDGSEMIVIKLSDKEGKPITYIKDSVFLVETGNPLADSCSFAKGLLKIPFTLPDSSLINKYDGVWISWAKKYSTGCNFMLPGHYAVVLNQGQKSCMIKNGSDYKYVTRVFEICIKRGDEMKKLSGVSAEKIYSLCTGVGPWKRIASIEFVLNN